MKVGAQPNNLGVLLISQSQVTEGRRRERSGEAGRPAAESVFKVSPKWRFPPEKAGGEEEATGKTLA